MKKKTKLILAIAALVIAACGTTKKNGKAKAPAPSTATMPSTPSPQPFNNFPLLKPANGIYAPGEQELKALQTRYADITLPKLQEGYQIYSQGACIKCHGAKNIYQFGETQWKEIVDVMAMEAKITDAQKDAVYKYVLSIKAVQPK